MTTPPPEPTEARPWRSEWGTPPRVTVYHRVWGPALYVWLQGRWRYAVVMARQDWAEGGVYYQVSLKMRDGDRYCRTYRWPQPGLRVAHLAGGTRPHKRPPQPG